MHKELANFLIALPRPMKRAIMILLDISISVFAFWSALCLRLESLIIPTEAQSLSIILTTVALIITLSATSQYSAIYRYLGLRSILSLVTALGFFTVAFAFIVSMRILPEIPKSTAVIYPILLFLLLVAIRMLVRFVLKNSSNVPSGLSQRRAYVYGAGSAGRQLTMALSMTNEMTVAGYIDDDPKTWGRYVNNLKVYSPTEAKEKFESLRISDLLLAIPSLDWERRRAIVNSFSNQKVKIKTLPGVSALATGNITASDLTDIRVEDLLGRIPSTPNKQLISHCTANKSVLVTGAGGSIGSEICKQVLATNPSTLILVELNEYGLYETEQQLAQLQKADCGTSTKIIPLIANIQNVARMSEILNRWKVETVYHAAAYKHVPLVEMNVSAAVENNIFGTLNMVLLGEQHDVENFVLISTDKAVRPTNFMGATKRVAEMILQSRAHMSENTKKNPLFSMVRFGNVLNSSGSVVPLFKKQIKLGGPVTLTHPDVTRYFMTIPEAAQLVIQAGSMSLGGDVFVLDMGEPVRIYDLAAKMIDLSGKTIKGPENPNGDIEIKVTGLRPGEKKFEELLIGDNPVGTEHPRIWKAYEEFLIWDELEPLLKQIDEAMKLNDSSKIQLLLNKIVVEYTPSSPIADLYKNCT